MKKLLLFIFCFASVFTCFGCKKKDNLSVLGKDKSNYEISINLDTENKSAKVFQTLDYINNTNSILKTLKLNLQKCEGSFLFSKAKIRLNKLLFIFHFMKNEK